MLCVRATLDVNILNCRKITQLIYGLCSQVYLLYKLFGMHNIILPKKTKVSITGSVHESLISL